MGKLENRKTGERENRGMGKLKNGKTGEWEMKDGKISGSAMTIKNKKLRCQRHLAKECEALHFLPVPKAQQKVPQAPSKGARSAPLPSCAEGTTGVDSSLRRKGERCGKPR